MKLRFNVFIFILLLLGLFIFSSNTHAAHSRYFRVVEDIKESGKWHLSKMGIRDNIVFDETFIDLTMQNIKNIREFKLYQYDYSNHKKIYEYSGDVIDGLTFTFRNKEMKTNTEGEIDLVIKLHPSNKEDVIRIPNKKGQSFYFKRFSDKITNNEVFPEIIGQRKYSLSVNDKTDISYFKNQLKAQDENDGIITDKIYLVEDNYSSFKNSIGKRNIVFGVKNKLGNESKINIEISLSDTTRPLIIADGSDIRIPYDKEFNIEDFKKTLDVFDNYDKIDKSTIKIFRDTYTPNKNKIGNYVIAFSVTDSSHNTGIFIKKIHVTGKVGPVIKAPETLSKPLESNLTIDDIKKQVTAIDNKDGDLTKEIIIIKDDYTKNKNKLGTYKITFEVTNSTNNKSNHTTTIKVIDNKSPIWFIKDGKTINIDSDNKVTTSNIVDLLISDGKISKEQSKGFKVIKNTYENNEHKTGNYDILLQHKDKSGIDKNIELKLNVFETKKTAEPEIKPIEKYKIKTLDWIFISLGIFITISFLILVFIKFKIKK